MCCCMKCVDLNFNFAKLCVCKIILKIGKALVVGAIVMRDCIEMKY